MRGIWIFRTIMSLVSSLINPILISIVLKISSMILPLSSSPWNPGLPNPDQSVWTALRLIPWLCAPRLFPVFKLPPSCIFPVFELSSSCPIPGCSLSQCRHLAAAPLGWRCLLEWRSSLISFLLFFFFVFSFLCFSVFVQCWSENQKLFSKDPGL